MDRDGVVHQVPDEGVGFRAHQGPQTDDPDEAASLVHDGDRVDRLDVDQPGADPVERLLRGHLRAGGDELGRHPAADGAGRVAEDLVGERALLGRQPAQEARGDEGRELVHESDAVVGVELLEEVGDLLLAQAAQQLGLHRRVEGLEQHQGAPLGQQPERDGPVAVGAALEHVHHDLVGQ